MLGSAEQFPKLRPIWPELSIIGLRSTTTRDSRRPLTPSERRRSEKTGLIVTWHFTTTDPSRKNTQLSSCVSLDRVNSCSSIFEFRSCSSLVCRLKNVGQNRSQNMSILQSTASLVGFARSWRLVAAEATKQHMPSSSSNIKRQQQS